MITPRSCGVDSLTILVPQNLCSFDTSLVGKIYEIDEDGEVLSMKNKPTIYDENGIFVKMLAVSLFGSDFFSLTISSKIMRFDYLKGLNFESIYSFLVTTFPIKISREAFMDCLVYDVDFFVDFELDYHLYNSLLTSYHSVPGSKLYYTKAESILDKRKLTGITFVSRDRATVSSPFVKVYSKLDELTSRSSLFLSVYPIAVKENHRRLEVTVKNRKHFISLVSSGVLSRFYDDKKFTLGTLFSINDLSICAIVNSLFQRHVGTTMISPSLVSVGSVIKPTEFMLGIMCYELMHKHGYSFTNVLSLFDSFPAVNSNVRSVSKSRVKGSLQNGFNFVRSLFVSDSIKITSKDAFFK